MRVNLGCGQAYMPGWVNVDASPEVKADIYLDAPEFVRQYGDQVAEVYMGHFLEHLLPGDALALLTLLCERLPKDATVSAVTPDIAAIWQAYQQGEVDNDQLNASFIYSYVQPSRHVWCYDEPSLLELFRRAGFADPEPIDPLTWPPVFHKEGPESRWQCGVRASALGARPTRLGSPPEVVRLTWPDVFERETESEGAPPCTPEELMLRRIQTLRDGLAIEAERRARLEQPAPPVVGRRTGSGATGDRRSTPPAAERAARAGRAAGVTSMTNRARIREVAKQKLPVGSRRREAAKAALTTYREAVSFKQNVRRVWQSPGLFEGREPKYAEWLRLHRPTGEELTAQTDYARRLEHPMRVHVVVLPGSGSLDRTVKSLTAQSWPRWTASVCTDQEDRSWPDERIRTASRTATQVGSPIAAANQAVLDTESDFVIAVRAGDALAPDCMYQVVGAARRDALVDLVTWDDDRFGADGHRGCPRFRSLTWSPETLLGANYFDRSFAMRRRRYLAAGGLRPEYGNAVYWELLLRAGLTDERVAHVGRVLSSVTDRPSTVGVDGVRAVQEQIERMGWPARAEGDRDMVRVRWELADPPHVTVVIPTRHNRRMLSTCLPSLARTDYPSFDVIIIDNGGHTPENEQWYVDNGHGLDLDVIWWDKDFNYSEVNNVAAAKARGDVLVFLNDDTELLDTAWMTELVGWSTRDGIGVVGLQLVGPDDRLQHAGVILGMGGFADHLFQGMRPGDDSLFGSTRWYRNTLAVTGACLAVRRQLFEEIGGFDQRFVLCGSDVVLGLDSVLRRKRNVCSPYARIRHLESATRGSSAVPQTDFFASYWRYNSWLFGGDPYFSPNLSLSSRVPALRAPNEPTTAERIGVTLNRRFQAFRQVNDEAEAQMLASVCRALPVDAAANADLHVRNAEPFTVETVNWFIPDVDSPFYGGINTALRIADYLGRKHGVRNRFVVFGEPNEMFIRSALAAAMPSLADSEIVFYRLDSPASLDAVPYADVSIATLWVTAYSVAHFAHTKRKFYLIQDFEPGFYPAGTAYALAEESYKLGLYGVCNTDNLLRIYRDDYDGAGMSFTPAVDQSVFHARWRHERTPDAPVTVFVYARPGHLRNCWEMAAPALEELKRRLGDGVRIVAAGAWAVGSGAEMDIKRLGLLDYQATGELYRHCDVGMALTVSKHPSYLPLELMACGVPVVAFDNPWGHWILRDGENALLAKRTVDGLVDCLERLCVNPGLRSRLGAQALADIAAGHSDWGAALAGIYPYLCDPEGHADGVVRAADQ
ncbi:MAG TPA: glycosyltransferase [Mycobacteriales bacterium]